MVAELQSVIGTEAREQVSQRAGRMPDVVTACVGGGSNAMGVFSGFVGIDGVRLVGVEAGGHGLNTELHGAAISGGTDGILHGARTRILQDPDGLIKTAHSVSAGLDYPGSGPEHAYLLANHLAEYHSVTDAQALDAFHEFSKLEGIIPALEPAHAIAWLLEERPKVGDVLLLLSGRGDKDVDQVREMSK
jgi:tryptophan synthase beta chain